MSRGSIENAYGFASEVLEIVSSSANKQLFPDLIRAASAENTLDYPPCWGTPTDSSYEMGV